jgi:hypothetical protein
MFSFSAADETTAFDIAMLVFSILGVVATIAAIIWGIMHFFLTGSKVKAEFRIGMMGPGGAVTKPVWKDMTESEVANLVAQGFNRPIIGVRVSSVRRSAATVDGLELDCDGPFKVQVLGDAIGPSFPHTIGGKRDENWYADASLIEAMRAGAEPLGRTGPLRVWANVNLGNDKSIRARGTLRA